MNNTTSNHHSGCILCGQPLVYGEKDSSYTCAVCGKSFSANVACAQGHYICDACHASAMPQLKALLLQSTERNPLTLLWAMMRLPGVHMHGPEHHSLIPGVLLVTYHNNGGSLDLPAALDQAFKRGSQVPGGFCGFFGVCGAAVGAGIYASIALGSHPLNAQMWGLPQQLSARCLNRNGQTGGPRCCKRTARIAIEEAAAFTQEHLGVSLPGSDLPCDFVAANRECLKERCPYFSQRD